MSIFWLLLVRLHIKVNNMPMMALVHPVFDCLMRLTHPDALLNEEEVRIYTTYRQSVLLLQIKMWHWSAPLPSLGGLSGAAATSHRRAAGERKQTTNGRAILLASGCLPAAGRPQLHVPPAAVGDPGVPSWRLVAQRHRRQVLLQWNCRVGLLQGCHCYRYFSQHSDTSV